MSDRKKIVCFGEIMLRLAPYNHEMISQAVNFQATYGGGEANVAVSLANFGHPSSFVSRIPANPVGDAAVNLLRKYGVDISEIVRAGSRLGIYFLEHGASIRPSKVIYDRAGSAIACAEKDDFKWSEILKEAEWLHITGITPALSPELAEISLEAVSTAKKMGLTVSCDLNYRNKLWTRDEAEAIMSRMVKFVDVIIANEEDCADVFGIEAESTDVTRGELDVPHYQSVAKQVMAISSAKKVAITLRESISASDNNWSAMLYNGEEFFLSRKYPIHIVDRVGGGDSFGAGLIHGLISGWDDRSALEFAVAASGLKQTVSGDMNLVSEADVMKVMSGDISGRVQR